MEFSKHSETCAFTVFSGIATFWVSRPLLFWVSPLGYYFESQTAKIIGMSSKPRWWWRFLCSQSLHGIFRHKSFSSLRDVHERETSIYQTSFFFTKLLFYVMLKSKCSAVWDGKQMQPVLKFYLKADIHFLIEIFLASAALFFTNHSVQL